jgi:hypothetical protein
MPKRSYRVAVVNRSTGQVRCATISRRAIVCSVLFATSFPTLVGLGARFSAVAEIKHLRTTHATLKQENASYRSAIGVFTEQVRSLDQVVDKLHAGVQSSSVSISRETLDALKRVRSAGATSIAAPVGMRGGLQHNLGLP